MNQQLLEKNQQKLLEEKKRLERLLGSFAKKEDAAAKEEYTTRYPNFGDSQEDNIAEVELYETNLGKEKVLEQRLHKVNAALERIKSGTYGRCLVGGEEIEEPRLKVAPEATTCIKHSQ